MAVYVCNRRTHLCLHADRSSEAEIEIGFRFLAIIDRPTDAVPCHALPGPMSARCQAMPLMTRCPK